MMKKRRRGVPMVLAAGIVLAAFTYVYAADLRNMIITYESGKKQTVNLSEPSLNIVKIEFSGGKIGSATGTVGDGGREYKDSKGGKVFLPCGRQAFADRVVSYNVGNPAPKDRRAMNPEFSVLGEPDYVSDEEDYKKPVFTAVTLGCGGSLTLEFTKVRIVDVPGPDIYVFEVGPAVEPTQLEISKDGVNWINIGRISGGKASVDIHNYVQPGDQFRYVRLTDLKSACGGDFPGADIDAVAAIGCVIAQD
jgi:hypothetical protein